APAPKPPERGYVVYVDSARVVIDLTNLDGLRPGAVLSLRRDRIPIVHPVTGELLGELDEEVATARVTEIRERFSVGDVARRAPGRLPRPARRPPRLRRRASAHGDAHSRRRGRSGAAAARSALCQRALG